MPAKRAGCDRSSSDTSLSLLERVKKQDPTAWTRLVDLYSPLIYRWCRDRDLRHEDTCEILQDVFAAVARSMDRFESNTSRSSFRGWLRTIATNRIHDHFRGLQKRPQPIGGTRELEGFNPYYGEADSNSAEFPTTDRQLLLRSALELVRGDFEAKTWAMFWSVVVDGRDVVDVAAETGVSPNTVRQAKSRILRRLRLELA